MTNRDDDKINNLSDYSGTCIELWDTGGAMMAASIANMPVGRNWDYSANLPNKISQSDAAALPDVSTPISFLGWDRKTDQAANLPLVSQSDAAALLPASCPKWEKCSANVCPLDPNWTSRTHREGERVCRALIETSKQGLESINRPIWTGKLLEKVLGCQAAILDRHYGIRAACVKAASTQSRMGRFGTKP